MSRSTLRAGLAALALAAVAGCQPPAVVPTPAPTPTFTCTPEAGGDAYECSQAQYDEMLAKNELYAEAEAVYRKFLAEDIRIMRAGGVMEPTPVLLETTTGAFLEDVMSDYRLAKKMGTRVAEGDRKLEWIRRLAGVSKGGSIVAIAACVDSTSSRFFVGDRYVGRGLLNRDDLYLARSEGLLRIIGADGEEVETCA